MPDAVQIARLIVIWACQGRRDLAEQTAKGNWDADWAEIGVSSILEAESDIKEELQAYFYDTAVSAAAAANEVFVERRWVGKPCPRNSLVAAALEAMIRANYEPQG